MKGYSYDPWGKVTNQTGTANNPYQYRGEYTDETGLQYLRARYYNPGTGRFTTEDTYAGQASNPQSLNRYTYVENNPLRYVDPSGHSLEDFTASFTDDFWENEDVKEAVRKQLRYNPVGMGLYYEFARAVQAGIKTYHDVMNIFRSPCVTTQQMLEATFELGAFMNGGSGGTSTTFNSGLRLPTRVGGDVDAYGGYFKRKEQRALDYKNKTGAWSPTQKTSLPNGPYRTDKEADLAAGMLGYKRVPEKSHGRVVYTNGNDFISPDTPRKTTGSTDNGGVWKKAKSPQDLLNKESRLGTYDKNLKRIGD